MADDENEREGSSSHKAEWEVVSLTASAYDAAPTPEGFCPPDEHRNEEFHRNERNSSDAMFMSGHFVFPPNEHENLPLDLYADEIQGEGRDEVIGSLSREGQSYSTIDEENLKFQPEYSMHGVQISDNGEQHSVHDMKFGERKALQGSNITGGDDAQYGSSGFSDLRGKLEMNVPEPCDPIADAFESDDPPEEDVDPLLDSNALNLNKRKKYDGSGLPSDAWWKRQAASWYRHARERNTFWSVFVAAALMGLVMLGRRWHRDNLKVQQLKWHLNINSERVKWMVGPMNRLKDILVGGHQPNLLVGPEAMPDHHGLSR